MGKDLHMSACLIKVHVKKCAYVCVCPSTMIGYSKEDLQNSALMPKNRGLMNDPWPHWPRESFSKWLNALEHNDRHRHTGCFCHLLNYSLQSVWWFSLFTLNWNIKALKSPSLYLKMQGRNVLKDIAKKRNAQVKLDKELSFWLIFLFPYSYELTVYNSELNVIYRGTKSASSD